jgi:hypothetical protein
MGKKRMGGRAYDSNYSPRFENGVKIRHEFKSEEIYGFSTTSEDIMNHVVEFLP